MRGSGNASDDRRRAMSELPTAYAVALRMHDRGAGDEAIADALGVPVESMRRLMEIAEAKLQAVMARDPRAKGSPPG